MRISSLDIRPAFWPFLGTLPHKRETIPKRGQTACLVEVVFPDTGRTVRRASLSEQALSPHLEMVCYAARQRQRTPEFREQYAKLAGIEGTLSQGVRRCEMRRSRYIGLARTHLQHLLTAAALNLMRAIAWLTASSHAKTRPSRFAALLAAC